MILISFFSNKSFETAKYKQLPSSVVEITSNCEDSSGVSFVMIFFTTESLFNPRYLFFLIIYF